MFIVIRLKLGMFFKGIDFAFELFVVRFFFFTIGKGRMLFDLRLFILLS